MLEREVPEDYSPEQEARYFVTQPGSDYMVQVLKSLGIDYVALNAGSSFRGLHESLINFPGDGNPQVLTCLHEEQAVALAHGYAKVAGKPMAVACHGTVGAQHAAMAVYNAWCDKVPVIILAGNHLDASQRNFSVIWTHSAQDPLNVIRDCLKWDDQPVSLEHFGESLVRGYRIAMTPPMAPVAIAIDAHLQEHGHAHWPPVPRLAPIVPPAADENAIRDAARRLVNAEAPVIVVERFARSQEGVELLIELAEALQAPVIDRAARMNFPNTHYLNQTFLQGQLIPAADVILALEVSDIWGIVQQGRDRGLETVRTARDNVFVVSIGAGDSSIKSNYQDFQRYYPTDLPMTGDAQASLPALIAEIKRITSAARRRAIGARKPNLQSAHRSMREWLRSEAQYGWNESPVSTARLCMELWPLIKDRDWALTSTLYFKQYWPHKLWDMDKFYQFIGDEGGYGLGYNCPASVGAALAHRAKGRFPINIQGDGDLMYSSGALWTAAHHKIPLLTVMHNNGAYMQEAMLVHGMAAQRRRGVDTNRSMIGNSIDNPRIDYATLARSMGVWASGPISDPEQLSNVLKEAVEVVLSGAPALVDVRCQPR